MQKPAKPTHAATDQRSGQCSQHPTRGPCNADRTGVPGIGGIHACCLVRQPRGQATAATERDRRFIRFNT